MNHRKSGFCANMAGNSFTLSRKRLLDRMVGGMGSTINRRKAVRPRLVRTKASMKVTP